MGCAASTTMSTRRHSDRFGHLPGGAVRSGQASTPDRMRDPMRRDPSVDETDLRQCGGHNVHRVPHAPNFLGPRMPRVVVSAQSRTRLLPAEHPRRMPRFLVAIRRCTNDRARTSNSRANHSSTSAMTTGRKPSRERIPLRSIFTASPHRPGRRQDRRRSADPPQPSGEAPATRWTAAAPPGAARAAGLGRRGSSATRDPPAMSRLAAADEQR
jgi:hypothetical protein